MKTYKDFDKRYIGSSDIASLTVRSGRDVSVLNFLSDGSYSAYEVIGNDVEIGSHYNKVFSGSTWLSIYDDSDMTYKARHDGMTVDIYRAGDFGCIIHWHE